MDNMKKHFPIFMVLGVFTLVSLGCGQGAKEVSSAQDPSDAELSEASVTVPTTLMSENLPVLVDANTEEAGESLSAQSVSNGRRRGVDIGRDDSRGIRNDRGRDDRGRDHTIRSVRKTIKHIRRVAKAGRRYIALSALSDQIENIYLNNDSNHHIIADPEQVIIDEPGDLARYVSQYSNFAKAATAVGITTAAVGSVTFLAEGILQATKLKVLVPEVQVLSLDPNADYHFLKTYVYDATVVGKIPAVPDVTTTGNTMVMNVASRVEEKIRRESFSRTDDNDDIYPTLWGSYYDNFSSVQFDNVLIASGQRKRNRSRGYQDYYLPDNDKTARLRLDWEQQGGITHARYTTPTDPTYPNRVYGTSLDITMNGSTVSYKIDGPEDTLHIKWYAGDYSGGAQVVPKDGGPTELYCWDSDLKNIPSNNGCNNLF